MRTVPFKQVFNKLARWHGYNPNKDIEPDTRDSIVDRINDRVLEICGVTPWPEWNITEQRAYRQVWNDSHQYFRVSTGGQPDEVFYKPSSSYYRVNVDAADDPPVGALPTNTTFWVPLDSTTVGTYIAYDQGCKRAIGSVLGVYSQNPRNGCGCNGSSGKLKFHVSANGVEICRPSGPTAFISYQQPVPKYTMVPYAAGKAYAKADIIFDPVTGECFQALLATDNPPTTTDWGRIPFLEKWEKYVTNGAYADGLFESDRKGNEDLAARQVIRADSKQAADDALQREIDLLTSQGNALKWATCQHGEYWCESQPWCTGGIVTEISDACESGWVFAEPPPQVPGPVTGCPTPDRCPDVAYVTEENIFQKVQGLPGTKFGTTTVNSDYTLTNVDWAVLVDASTGPVTITVPMALGTGQFYHISKADDSANPVIINASPGDMIDGDSVVLLGLQYADIAMIDIDLGRWDRFGIGTGPSIDLSNYARIDVTNEFEAVQNFTGVQYACRTVTSDYTLTEDDFTVLVDATAGHVTISLPPSGGNGQMYHIKKIDVTGNFVSIERSGADLIDDAVSINFDTQWSNVLVQAAAPGFWSNIGPFNVVFIQDPVPPTPTTTSEIVALLQSYGLCA